MGIFVEEASAFIVAGLIGLVLMVIHYQSAEPKGDTYRAVYLILLVVCLILATIGIADVFLDHIGSDENSQQTTP